MTNLRSLFLSFMLLTFLAVNAQITNDTTTKPKSSFLLGQVDIVAQALHHSIKKEVIETDYRNSVVKLVVNSPSVSLIFSGSRNESAISIQGFDLRSIPVFIDGIPVSASYDGYMDLSRINIGLLDKIEISKGFSSILYGPNTIGGTINLVTPKPEHQLVITSNGYVSRGNEYNGNISVGQKYQKFYYQVGYSKSKRDYIPLSENFTTSKVQQDLKLDNSWQNNSTFNAKIGFTPNERNEFSIAYYVLDGEKGNPIYLGNDKNIKVRYWQWPEWRKEGIRFIARDEIGHGFSLRTHLYYDKLANTLKSYDDNTYTTQTKASSFTSLYRDENIGGSVQLAKMLFKQHELTFATQFRNENHRENNIGEPIRHFIDNSISTGIEDYFTINSSFSLTGGINFNYRDGAKAEEYNSKTKEISEYPANNDNSINYQIAGIYKADNLVTTLTLARKSRFATMKDRYSYRMGLAIPNVNLKSEEAYKTEISVNWTPAKALNLQATLFYHLLDNTIQYVNEVEPGIAQMQNTGKSKFFGGDISLTFNPTDYLSIWAVYNYLKRENTTTPEIRFTDIPEGKIISGFDISPIKSIHTILNLEYDASSYSTSYGTKNPDFVILDFSLRFQSLFGLEIEAGVNNIFDLNYTRTEGYYERGRDFYLSLSYNFKSKH